MNNLANTYKRIVSGINQQQLLSAKIMQRSNLIILPLVFTSFIVGAMSEYNQDPALYFVFTVVNALLGIAILFFHSTGNGQVRDYLSKVKGRMTGKIVA